MKSILNIAKEVADLSAVKRPESLFNSASLSDSIFLSVAKSTLDSLLRYGDWPELVREASFVTTPPRKYYQLSEICPDFYALIPNTIYIKDSKEKIIGSITAEEWIKSKYISNDALNVKFRIEHGMIKFISLPDDPVKIVFQYRANFTCLDAKTFIEKSDISADSDFPIFDEYLVKIGMLWRWLKRSGLDYSEEYNEYERELKKKFAASVAAGDINLTSQFDNYPQGVTLNVKVVC